MTISKTIFAISSVLLLSGCGSSAIQVNGAIAVPSAFAVTATGESVSMAFSGTDYENWPLEDGGTCIADDGYDDINEGAQVTVKNEAGEVLGVGALSSGVQTGSEGFSYQDFLREYTGAICSFSFSFEVPGGASFYSLSVGNDNRGEITYTAEELAEGVFLTLGD